MSAATYGRLATTATRLIREYGQPWTITRTTGPGTSVQRTARAVRVGTVRHTLGDSGVDIGDVELLLEPAANPEKRERVAAGADDLVIMHVEPIKPAAILLAWRAWGRAG